MLQGVLCIMQDSAKMLIINGVIGKVRVSGGLQHMILRSSPDLNREEVLVLNQIQVRCVLESSQSI